MSEDGSSLSPKRSGETTESTSQLPVSDSQVASGQDEGKITVRFRPMGATRRLQTNLFRVNSSHEFSALIAFLRRKLNFSPENSLFCYINASFSPALDTCLDDLAASYAIEGVLTVYYCVTVAFG